MKLVHAIFHLSYVAVAVVATKPMQHLRSKNSRQLVNDFSCIVSMGVGMPGDDKPPEHGLSCEGETGLFMAIEGLPDGFIKSNIDLLTFEEGQEEVILHAPAATVRNNKVDIDPSSASQVRLTTRGNPKRGRRELYNTWKPTGVAKVLVLRITTSQDNKSPSESAAIMSDKVFGTNGDSVNLKSQMAACSYDQKTISVGTGTGVVNGVLEVSIDNAVTTSFFTLVDDATTAAQNILGVSPLSSTYDHVMYCLPPNAMPYIAYGWYNNFRTAYSDYWCGRSAAQMHEIGHNLNLRHSNEESAEYGDNVGYMGSSPSNHDTRRCYNTLNSVRLGWYADRVNYIDDVTSIASSNGWTGKIIGPTDYENSISGIHSTAVRLKNPVRVDGRRDIYVGYNRQEGMNANTADAINQVTVVKGTGDVTNDTLGSSLLAKLSVGGSYTINNYDDAGTHITVTFLSSGTDLDNIEYAYVRITSTATEAPTPVPTTAAPTPVPTTAPPTFPAPTATPTTPLPTATPTSAPTYDCSQFTQKKDCPTNGCSWDGNPNTGSCVSINPPGPTTPTAPPPSPPSTCSSENCGGCSGGGDCRGVGCTWNKGTCS